MSKKWVVLLGVCIVVLGALAIFLTTERNSDPKVAITYELNEYYIENNNAIVKFTATVAGTGTADPITNVQMIDANGFSMYPLNGYLKQSVTAGSQEVYEFQFPFPSTIQCTLEIKNSLGELQNIGVQFPDVAAKDKTIKADDTLVGIGESFTKDDSIKYTINEYHFTTAGGSEIAPEGYHYLLVTVVADNILTETSVEVANSFFTLKNVAEAEINAVDVAVAGGKNPLDTVLGPGESITGQLTYLVPKEEKELYLYFKGEKIFKIISE